MKVYIKLKYRSEFRINTNFSSNRIGRACKKRRKVFYRKRKNPNSKSLIYNMLVAQSRPWYPTKGLTLSTSIQFSKPSVFIQKSNKTVFTILRAPYRYKKGRYQVGKRFYKATISFYAIFNEGLSLKNDLNIRQTTGVIKLLNDHLSSFSTNLLMLSSLSIRVPVNNPDIFKLTNYKV